jgi:hypothetical protein
MQVRTYVCSTVPLTLSLAAHFSPPCLEALGLIGPRKKEKKTGELLKVFRNCPFNAKVRTFYESA